VYAVRVGERARVQQALAGKGVQTNIHYPVPVHLQPAWSGLGYARGAFPHSEAAADESLSLPMYPEIAAAQIERVAAALKGATNV
jgi:dTDP-4-amino-4,6-dideoxygalactose transaminase